MSSSIIPILMIFFIPFFFLHVIQSSLVDEVCSNTRTNFNSKLCIQILRSDRSVVSATNLFDLSISIIKFGISNTTKTQTYIENMLKKSIEKGGLQECKWSYDSVIVSLNSALSEVEYDKEYQTATYDLLIASTDNIQRCEDAVASGKIKDGTILRGNKVVPIFGLSAYEAVERLSHQSKLQLMFN